MYKIGDIIVYGNTGVCTVAEIKTLKLRGADRDRLYYSLKPLYQDGTISVPVDNQRVASRPIISRAEAEKLISDIPGIVPAPYACESLTRLKAHYDEAINAIDCLGLLEMTVSIYAKKQEAERLKKKFGAIDSRYLKRAEDLLFGELAVALDISRDRVQEYIYQRLH